MRNNYQTLKSYLSMMIGTLVAAIGINLMACKNLAFGGVSGLAIVLEFMTGIPISALNLIINIPLFLLGMKCIGKRFLVRSVFSTAMLSVFLDLSAMARDFQVDLILSAIFGGILLGFGVAIIAKSGGSTGGTDMLAIILHDKTKKPLGNYMLLIDGSIIVLGGITFGLNKAMYSLLVVFFISRSVNETMKHYDEVIQKISLPLHRKTA